MSASLLFLSFALPSFFVAPGQAVGHAGFEHLVPIESAYYARDSVAAVEALEDVPPAPPLDRAWALWRVALTHPLEGVDRQTRRSNEELRKAFLDEAETLLGADVRSGVPVALLILSQVYQARITGMVSGMRYGRRAGETLARALELDPQSPHALYFQGINLLMAPGPFGDKDQGRARLRQAVQIFDANAASGDAATFQWGHAEALAQLGFALFGEGDSVRAQEFYTRARALAPEDYAWVRDELLPDFQ